MSARWRALRERAQAILDGRPPSDAPAETDLSRLIHELQTHQIELELQNDELRRAEQQLTESRNRYADLYDFAPVGYLTLAPDGRIVEANLTAAKLLGTERRSLIGKRLARFIAAEQQDDLHLHFRQLLRAGQSPPCEIAVPVDGSNQRWLELRSVAEDSDDENRPRVRCSLSDVTERREAERAVRQASRMDAVATLAAGAAHDFNNLMVPVLTNATLLLEEFPDESDPRRMLEEIRAAARSAAALAQQLVAFARSGHHQPVPIDFGKLVDETFTLHHGLLAEIAIERDFEPDLWGVVGDGGQLQQVVMNLLINATEAVEGLGTIRVAAANVEMADTAEDRSGGLPAGRYVRFAVRDSGCGMAGETRDRVFEPFFSTKFQGRGLGLAAVYGIVRQHHGAIELESTEGAGTTFTVWLPATDQAPPALQPVEAKPCEGSETVLVIDDDELVVAAATRLLGGLGYRVLSALTGEAAQKLARAEAGTIHLALLDMGISTVGGAQLYAILRQARPDMRILLCTGRSWDPALESLLGAGAVGLVPKPFAFDELGRRVRQALDEPR